MQTIELDQPIATAIAQHAPVALGVSGGKDSSVLALATNARLDVLGHRGPRVLIHADLGRTEWRASLPMCQQLADRLGLELIVVRREKGDMLARWQQRWHDNVQRYINLECVKLILPWSTPEMRFCTSELKVAVICRELVRRYPGQQIISASGIRREESTKRAKAPVSAPQVLLSSKRKQTHGFDWHPLLAWTRADVFSYHRAVDFPLHEAYTRYGTSRVSCAYCILGSKPDLLAATTCADNQELYRQMVQLEIDSTFGFQDKHWLGDVAHALLTAQQRWDFAIIKRRAQIREEAEARIPKHLLYTKGWPTCVPTYTEAQILADVRKRVAEVVQLDVLYTTPETVIARYSELIAMRKEP